MVLRTTETTCSINGFQSFDVVNNTPAYSQIQTITGNFATNFFGLDTVISQDGNYLIIASRGYNNSRGRVSIYLWDGSQYVFQTNIDGTNTQNQYGVGIAINSDGTYLAIGTNNNSPTNFYPSVRIYTRSGTTWTLQQVIQSGVTQVNTLFGYSMAFSIAGDQLIVGASGEGASNLPGAIYMFSRSGTTWTQNATFKGLSGSYVGLGISVDTNDAGDIAVTATGGPAGFPTAGSRWYTRSGSTWSFGGALPFTYQSSVTSLTNDGNYWATGANIYYPVNSYTSVSTAGTQPGLITKDGNYFINTNNTVYIRNVNNWDQSASYFTYPAGGQFIASNLTGDRIACLNTVPISGVETGIVSILVKN